jgi:hypothetical protein
MRKRIDPVSRSASGVKPVDQIRNLDPGRHYVLANPNDEDTGVAYYLGIGYEVEKLRAGGPVPKVVRPLKDGEAVTVSGQHLMSISIEEKQARDAELAGPSLEMEKDMVKSGGIDGLRGFIPGTLATYEDAN